MKVARWGNSLAVRIPKDVALALGLKEDDEIELVASEERVLRVARPMTRKEEIESLRRFRGLLPDDFQFDREEANAR